MKTKQIYTKILPAIVISFMMMATSCSKRASSPMDLYSKEEMMKRHMQSAGKQQESEPTMIRILVAYEGEQLTEREN